MSPTMSFANAISSTLPRPCASPSRPIAVKSSLEYRRLTFCTFGNRLSSCPTPLPASSLNQFSLKSISISSPNVLTPKPRCKDSRDSFEQSTWLLEKTNFCSPVHLERNCPKASEALVAFSHTNGTQHSTNKLLMMHDKQSIPFYMMHFMHLT